MVREGESFRFDWFFSLFNQRSILVLLLSSGDRAPFAFAFSHAMRRRRDLSTAAGKLIEQGEEIRKHGREKSVFRSAIVFSFFSDRFLRFSAFQKKKKNLQLAVTHHPPLPAGQEPQLPHLRGLSLASKSRGRM